MKKGWVQNKLSELCDVYNGLWKGKKPPYINVGVIRNANFTKDFTLRFDNIEYLDVEERQYSTRKLQKGDLIIEKSGGSEKQPVGRAVVFDKEDGEFSFSNFTSVLRIKDQSNLFYRYLYLYLLFSYSRGDTLKMQKATTGIHNIDFKEYLNTKVPVPSLSEQQAIVSRLDSAFAKIDAVKANAGKQLNDAKVLFQKELSKAMTPKEGWEEKKVGECFVSINNGANIKQIKGARGIPITRIETLSNGVFNRDRMGFANIDTPNDYLNYILNDDDILMSHINSMKYLGRMVVYNKVENEIIIHGMNLLRLVARKGINSTFIFYQSKLETFKKEIESISHQSVNQASFNITNLKGIGLLIPPLSEQQTIVTHLDTLSEKLKAVEEKQKAIMAECDAMKQALLREVF